MRVRFLFAVVAALCVVSSALAATALGRHMTSTVQDRTTHTTRTANVLRHHVVKNRRVAWRWQDKANLDHTRTARRERRTSSTSFLRYLVHWWHDKAYEAMAVHHKREQRAASAGPFAIDSCTRALLAREGGMNPHAWNTSGSGAYGGPQALPGEKMASAGADWRDNIWTQIRWMLGYMQANYGGSCNALSHSYAYGWY